MGFFKFNIIIKLDVEVLIWIVYYNINILLLKKWSVDFRLIFYEWSILFYYINNVRFINL